MRRVSSRPGWVSAICGLCCWVGVQLGASGVVRGDLIINLVNGGGAAPTLTGTGDLSYIMRSAADVWQLAYNSNSFQHTVTIEYRWAGLGSGTLGVHNLVSQGGTPNREISALIRFDNDGSSAFFADGSLGAWDPLNLGNTEFSTFSQTSANYGGGLMNNGRVFTGASGAAAGRFDLYSIALHEIGHALGLSSANTSYGLETLADNDIDITAPFLFAGAAIPTYNSGSSLNAHLNIGSAAMYPFASAGVRKLPSAVDIFANAQLSQFFNPNFNLTAIPEPAGAMILALGGLMLIRRRHRRT